ncbi:MAG: TIGR04282 family arsenosugar biosynthesis glycosyltransferase, partial [Rhodothermales bacterium]
HAQSGADLGSRMLRAFAETFAAGYERAAIVGTDHPTLPSQFIEHAFEALDERRSVVVGPAEDGGYYLLGMNELLSGLFLGMEYSHAAVLDETLARVADTGARLTVLPLWYDIDTAESLERLAAELREAENVAPRTSRILQELAGSHGWPSRET